MNFLKNFFKHPFTWTFLSLLSVGVAIAVPPVAPILVGVAAGSMVFGVIAALVSNKDLLPKHASDFIVNHPIQALFAFIGIGLLITTLVLTIGFFTGGAGFAFMAPVFAVLAAPFVPVAAAAAGAGLSLSVPALAGATLVLASVTIPNMFKRLSAWLDSFTRDAALVWDDSKPLEKDRAGVWTTNARSVTDDYIKKNGGYLPAFFKGVAINIEKGYSPDTQRLEDEKPKNTVTNI